MNAEPSRSRFLLGLTTENEYWQGLFLARADPAAADATLYWDLQSRSDQVDPDWHSYGLPAVRDASLEGLLTPAQVRRQLEADGMPGDVVQVEVEYQAALAARRRGDKLTAAGMLPYNRAYVNGLIGPLAYVDALGLAGFPGQAGLRTKSALDSARRVCADARLHPPAATPAATAPTAGKPAP